LPHVPARPHRMALLSIGICWAVATINAQLSPGQNRQSSPLITPAYHGLESLVIAGQERLTDWLRIPAPPCLPPRPLEPARRWVWQLCCHGRFSRDPERGRTLHRLGRVRPRLQRWLVMLQRWQGLAHVLLSRRSPALSAGLPPPRASCRASPRCRPGSAAAPGSAGC